MTFFCMFCYPSAVNQNSDHVVSNSGFLLNKTHDQRNDSCLKHKHRCVTCQSLILRGRDSPSSLADQAIPVVQLGMLSGTANKMRHTSASGPFIINCRIRQEVKNNTHPAILAHQRHAKEALKRSRADTATDCQLLIRVCCSFISQ